MDTNEKVQYWLKIVESDLDTAEYLFKGGRWLYAAFMCHQVIEKMLKAYWTATRDDNPLYTHSHARLLEECGLLEQLSAEQKRFIAMMTPMNIEARYPDYKHNVASTLNADNTGKILTNTKAFKQWIEEKLSLSQRSSNSSDGTSN